MVDDKGNRTYSTDKDENQTYHYITFKHGTITNITNENIKTKDKNIKDDTPITLFSVKGDLGL